jgi:hypothetical protein
MEDIISQIMAIVGPALITAIGIIVTWGLNELRRWVKSKTDSEAINAAFNSFGKITTSAVLRAEQAMKEFASDGKITPSEAVKIKKMVFQEVKNQITPGTEKVLKKAANDVDDLIDAKIEEMVFMVKQKYKNRR